MTSNEQDYHRKRAQEEIAQAEQARDRSAKRVHRELAELHAEAAGEAVPDGQAESVPQPASGS